MQHAWRSRATFMAHMQLPALQPSKEYPCSCKMLPAASTQQAYAALVLLLQVKVPTACSRLMMMARKCMPLQVLAAELDVPKLALSKAMWSFTCTEPKLISCVSAPVCVYVCMCVCPQGAAGQDVRWWCAAGHAAATARCPAARHRVRPFQLRALVQRVVR